MHYEIKDLVNIGSGYSALADSTKQLERLRSEIPPTTTWLPIVVIHIRSQVKIRQF